MPWSSKGLLIFGILFIWYYQQGKIVQAEIRCPSQIENINIKYGDTLTCSMDEDSSHAFLFPGNSEEKIIIKVARAVSPLKPCLELFDPNGDSIAAACKDQLTQEINVQLAQPGLHTIVVQGRHRSTGSYSLGLARITPSSASSTLGNWSRGSTGQQQLMM